MTAVQNRKIGFALTAVFVVCGLFPALHGETGNYLLLVLAPVLFLAAVLRPSLYDVLRRACLLLFAGIVYLAFVVPLRVMVDLRLRRGLSFWKRF